jgi:hypothetical protein
LGEGEWGEGDSVEPERHASKIMIKLKDSPLHRITPFVEAVCWVHTL